MDKREAIEFLRQCLNEITRLSELKFDNNEYLLFHRSIRDVLIAVFRLPSIEYNDFSSCGQFLPVKVLERGDSINQKSYIKNLKCIETALKSIIRKYEILGFETKPSVIKELPPKAFIAHGGDSPALRKLKSYLDALGVQPLIVEEQPSEGRSIAENVDYYARQSDFAIILATKGDIDGKTGGFIPRGNVSMEIGKLQEILKDRIVYLLQAGTKLPTDISEKVRERFTQQSMDNAFIKVAKELKKCRILKAAKPQE